MVQLPGQRPVSPSGRFFRSTPPELFRPPEAGEPLAEAAKRMGLRFVLFSYVDLLGTLRSKLVPASALAEVSTGGAGFAGFAAWFDLNPSHPDVLGMPAASTLIPLPWKPEVGFVHCNLEMSGKPLAQAPRNALQATLKRLKDDHALTCKTGVELEFHLIDASSVSIADAHDKAVKPCYDTSALMRRYDTISEIVESIDWLGWKPYQSDHEDANGQFEINWEYDDALVTADRQTFFKYLVKSIAEKNGLRATFMPKPFISLSGNSGHTHVTLHKLDQAETNIFKDKGREMGISETGYHFLGGIMLHAKALCAITNPTVNSYKRINAPVTRSGATWSPNTISYGGNNRTHMVRIPDAPRFEVRLPDAATNPYLLPAALTVAGADGMAKKISPGTRADVNMYDSTCPAAAAARAKAGKLPLNLLDAIRELENTESGATLLAGLDPSGELGNAYLKLKKAEWSAYVGHLSEWELENSLDC